MQPTNQPDDTQQQPCCGPADGSDSGQQELFTVVVYSENCVGLLNQLSIIMTRRGVNIEGITASRCSDPAIHKTTLTCAAPRPLMEQIVKLIEKRIDVLRAFLYTDDDVVYQEVALYKVPTGQMLGCGHVEQIIRRHGARILDVNPEFTVIEKTGHIDETEALLHELEPYGIRQFARSGRVVVTRSPIERVDEYLALQEIRCANLLNLMK